MAQARAATNLINVYQQRSVELARLRKEAIERASTQTGMTLAAIAKRLGLSKGRITQIRQSAPAPERALFGVGPLTVAVPLRDVVGRPLGAVATEDSLSLQKLTNLLHSLAFTVEPLHIPTDGRYVPPLETIAICGPKSSPVTAVAIEADPFISFAPDSDGRWVLRDKTTGQVLISPMDIASGGAGAVVDYAYVARLPYQDRSLFVIAGVHALGSIGAVDYLTNNLTSLYNEVKQQHFSMVVRSEFTGQTVNSSTLLIPARVHQ